MKGHVAIEELANSLGIWYVTEKAIARRKPSVMDAVLVVEDLYLKKIKSSVMKIQKYVNEI